MAWTDLHVHHINGFARKFILNIMRKMKKNTNLKCCVFLSNILKKHCITILIFIFVYFLYFQIECKEIS